MTHALDQLRILDLTQGPIGGLATMVLADFGAEVLRIERPGGDPFEQLAAAPMWLRGKHRLPLDLNHDPDRETLTQLCAAADVLVTTWRTHALVKHGLTYEHVHSEFPHLIYCHIHGFDDPDYAHLPGYEHLVAAHCGRMLLFSGIADRPGPVFSAPQVGIHATAQSALTGILAASLQQQHTHTGQLVETSLVQGMLPYEQGGLIGIQFPEQFAALPNFDITPEPPPPSLYYHPAQAGDGRWMQFGNLLPHLFDNFLLVTDLMDVIADPTFNAKQLLLSDPEKHEAFRERMLQRIQQKSAPEWMQACIDNGGVVAAPYQTTQEALHDPDVVANGHAHTWTDGTIQLGPLARLSDTPAYINRDTVDGHTRSVAWRNAPRARAASTAPDTLPLEGVKVVEIATIIAAPQAAAFLADMGADVIKIEQIGGDPFRGLLMGIGAARTNAGKRSISLDLKSPAGREIALKLIADADVLIHNYRPGVPERLGIDYDQVKALNPGLVYLQCNGYGPDGPGAHRPSTHPIPGAAMGGVLYQLGERVPQDLQDIDNLIVWTRRLMRANELNPDPNTSLVITSACLLALAARTRTGRGQHIYLDMFGANTYANHDDFLKYPNKPPRLLPDALLHGLSARYRLYPCQGGQWLFLAIPSAKDAERFLEVMAAHTNDVTQSLLENNDDRTAAVLGTLFATHTAEHWESLLVPAGVGAVRADRHAPAQFWFQHPGTAQVEHPVWGQYRRHGANVTFNGQADLKPPPLAGQHNEELLRELGYTDAEINALEREGVIYAE